MRQFFLKVSGISACIIVILAMHPTAALAVTENITNYDTTLGPVEQRMVGVTISSSSAGGANICLGPSKWSGRVTKNDNTTIDETWAVTQWIDTDFISFMNNTLGMRVGQNNLQGPVYTNTVSSYSSGAASNCLGTTNGASLSATGYAFSANLLAPNSQLVVMHTGLYGLFGANGGGWYGGGNTTQARGIHFRPNTEETSFRSFPVQWTATFTAN